MEQERLLAFQNEIHYRFKEEGLLYQALCHSSYANEKKMNRLSNNERLEFLGDAVLELISSEFIFTKNQQMQEGDMTRFRASLVCEPTLALCARQIQIGEYLLLGKGEEATGGRERDSILSDAMEALIGAIYLDGGFTSAKEFVCRFVLSDIDKKQLFFDSKTILQEFVQGSYSEPLHYELLGEEGPDHNKKFTVRALIGEKEISTGCGRTKKAAEQEAAYQAILEFKTRGNDVSKKH